MRTVLLMTLVLATLGLVSARPARFTFVPGSRLGPLVLGQPVKASLAALKGWSYTLDDEYALGPYYIFPQEKKGALVQFILGYDRARKLRDIEIHDPSCTLEGHPEIHLGCTRQEMERVLGTRPDFSDDYCEYADLGIRFMFESGLPPRAEDPHAVPKFAKGQCETIQIFVPKK